MTWFVLSLTAALGLATADALTKRFLSDLAPYHMGLVRILSTAPWMALALLFLPRAAPDATFWLAVGAALPLELAAFFLYMKALKLSPLSLSLPFLAFTPVFMILTGRLILGEAVTAGGAAGIGLIVAGAYVLNLSRVRTGFLEPVRAVIREPGSWIMLLVSFLYSLTAPVGKVAILHSNPWFFAAVYNLVLAAVIVLIRPVAGSTAGANGLFSRPVPMLLIGLAAAAENLAHMMAIAQVEAAYMIAVKRLSLLFGVLYGAWWFGEQNIRERLAGAAIMIAGVFLIRWAQGG
ncbi:MAG: EamA-like transporter family protein [Syntrophaceae bacterium PtaU1.Bin231]|nr:MAG: EamA-like transporter family protein [Syntrophaceae bacterium PtaU1.Bin231]